MAEPSGDEVQHTTCVEPACSEGDGDGEMTDPSGDKAQQYWRGTSCFRKWRWWCKERWPWRCCVVLANHWTPADKNQNSP